MTSYHVEVPTLLRDAGALREIRQVRREAIQQMRPYEIMVIFDPALEEQVIQGRVDDSTKLIETRGGEPGRVERWGKRRLAYEINHQRDGYYVLIAANAEPDTMTELGRSLLLADDVLRYKVMRIPDKIAAKAASAPSAPPPPVSAAPPPPAEPIAAQADEGVAAEEAAAEASINPNGEQNDG
ncbi:MAG TPA: 30S ribosomal protein S6 [Acidimicrobiales bacterium]|nr:30S ribosomal protein S6 [Acidimicrobiales bacterium]